MILNHLMERSFAKSGVNRATYLLKMMLPSGPANGPGNNHIKSVVCISTAMVFNRTLVDSRNTFFAQARMILQSDGIQFVGRLVRFCFAMASGRPTYFGFSANGSAN